MKKLMLMLAAFALAGCTPYANIATTNCDHTADRSANVLLGPATIIRVDAGAGSLRIEGQKGLNEVRVKGTACASSSQLLDQVQLVAEQVGSEVRVVAQMPGSTGINEQRRLDLVIQVPDNLPLKVADGSGDTSIKGVGPLDLTDDSGNLDIVGVSGELEVVDGSGDTTVKGVRGNVSVTDDSGNLTIDDVTGNATIPQDGSGDIRVSRVSRSVNIDEDGSGDIDVSDVGGDFTVKRDGSGDLHYDQIHGRMDISQGN